MSDRISTGIPVLTPADRYFPERKTRPAMTASYPAYQVVTLNATETKEERTKII